jgi:hypothetical protein
MILIRAGMGPKSTEQTLMHEMIHAKISEFRGKVHGKMFSSELHRLRKLGAPLSPGELDLVRHNSNKSREPPRLDEKTIRGLIRDAMISEKLNPKVIPRFLEHELMIPYSVLRTYLDVDREIRNVQRVTPAAKSQPK